MNVRDSINIKPSKRNKKHFVDVNISRRDCVLSPQKIIHDNCLSIPSSLHAMPVLRPSVVIKLNPENTELQYNSIPKPRGKKKPLQEDQDKFMAFNNNNNNNNITNTTPLPISPYFLNYSGGQDCVLSAGFLFYSFPPRSHDVYFLIGMDAYNNKWSDFGGRRNHNETEMMCAAREMMEETMGTLKFFTSDQTDCLKADDYYKKVLKELISKHYTYRIGVDITPKKDKKIITTQHFNVHSLSVNYKNPFVHEYTNMTRYSSPNFSSPLKMYPDPNNPNSPPTSLPEGKKLRVCYVKHVPWQPDISDTFQQVYQSLLQLSQIEKLKDQIEFFNTLPDRIRYHPACVVHKDSTGNIIQFSIKPEWMEKNQVAWWSLPRLKNVLRNGGKYKKNIFRYGFLSTLSMVVEKFTHLSAKQKFNNPNLTLCSEIKNKNSIDIISHSLLHTDPISSSEPIFDALPSEPIFETSSVLFSF